MSRITVYDCVHFYDWSTIYSWQCVHEPPTREQSNAVQLWFYRVQMFNTYWSKYEIIDIIKTLNWKCWRVLASNPKYNNIEYGGYILNYDGIILNPVLLLGGAYYVEFTKFVGLSTCSIHTHPSSVFKNIYPSAADLMATMNEGWQIIVSRYGIVIYMINDCVELNPVTHTYFKWTIEHLNFIVTCDEDTINTYNPHIFVHFISWDLIKEK